MAFLDHCIYYPTIGGIISDITIIVKTATTSKGGKVKKTGSATVQLKKKDDIIGILVLSLSLPLSLYICIYIEACTSSSSSLNPVVLS
jgi:hypothetical protein